MNKLTKILAIAGCAALGGSVHAATSLIDEINGASVITVSPTFGPLPPGGILPVPPPCIAPPGGWTPMLAPVALAPFVAPVPSGGWIPVVPIEPAVPLPTIPPCTTDERQLFLTVPAVAQPAPAVTQPVPDQPITGCIDLRGIDELTGQITVYQATDFGANLTSAPVEDPATSGPFSSLVAARSAPAVVFSPIPEPSTLLLGSVFALFAAGRRKRRF